MGEIEVGTCECCGKENVNLMRKYFYYPIKCECCSPEHFVLIRHCGECEPTEPRETKIILKTKDLKSFKVPFKMK